MSAFDKANCRVSSSPGPAYAAINLLPEGPLSLAPNNFDADDAECSSRQVLRATYDGFALPRAPQQLSILLSATGLSCQGTSGQPGVLLGLEGVDVALDCAKRESASVLTCLTAWHCLHCAHAGLGYLPASPCLCAWC